MLRITEKALLALEEIRKKEGEGVVLKVESLGMTCCGPDFAVAPVQRDNIRNFLESKSANNTSEKAAGWVWLENSACYPTELASYLDDADLDYVEKGWKTGFQIRRFTH